MMIRDLDVESIAVPPAETDPILVVDSHAVLSCPISFQSLQPIRGRRRKIAKFPGAVDLDQGAGMNEVGGADRSRTDE
jgi:hypothetical protein